MTEQGDDQAEVVAFMTGLAGAKPVETHISAVFLGPDTAWKLKKAVRLSFLDFTRLEARERFCRRELALNAPAAPGLYRDVVPVTRQGDGTLALNGSGAVVDWVLRMARVPEGDFLDRIAARGGLDPALCDQLGDAVAAFHAALPPIRGVDLPAAMARVVAGNATSARDAGLDADRVAAWEAAAMAAIAGLSARLAARAAQGFVRRCHGDLHLGNLCLWRGRTVPFDALEFDEALATIDTGYDLAFLLMDIDQRAGRAAANRVLSRYVARTGDVALVAALPLHLSIRAMVRAHVTARIGDAAAGAVLLDAAHAYLSPPPPVLAAIGGLQGTGKTTLARALSPRLGPAPGALVLRSDETRKRLAGIAPEERLPAEAYTKDASAAVYVALLDAAATALANGHAAIVDGMFLTPVERDAIEQVARTAHVPFAGLWLEAPRAVLEARLAARRGDASDADAAVLAETAQRDTGAIAWARLDAAAEGLAARAEAVVNAAMAA
ncbi:bifunctional aminoglycoside phosphotransferase/ATP-binding protein [Elioraea sp.]|uniref:bifunctional aminoglycoside phosphotransferase/ATP-binding protein n=1 Tax=Elioraea sp. TaxID=2185103 RepID=UPI0025C356A2|nr:bifunctional aminoglycoside phosphotransferase/ATP-binding protein [Elioraea sp.]